MHIETNEERERVADRLLLEIIVDTAVFWASRRRKKCTHQLPTSHAYTYIRTQNNSNRGQWIRFSVASNLARVVFGCIRSRIFCSFYCTHCLHHQCLHNTHHRTCSCSKTETVHWISAFAMCSMHIRTGRTYSQTWIDVVENANNRCINPMEYSSNEMYTSVHFLPLTTHNITSDDVVLIVVLRFMYIKIDLCNFMVATTFNAISVWRKKTIDKLTTANEK